AFHPFASRMPFETWIMPMQHDSCFGHITDEGITDLARVLHAILNKLYFGLGNPDFNYVIHTALVEDEHKHYFMWHIQILPRLTLQAGFELGSGMYINIALPEETAAFMREVEAGGISEREPGGEASSVGGI
ncbi:MAG: galactose-1-phosphate uridylyltransferase, partial [Armatimonadota bacterium]